MNRVVGRAAAVPGFGQLVQRARNPRRQGAFWDARRAFFGESHREKFLFFLLATLEKGAVWDGAGWTFLGEHKTWQTRAASGGASGPEKKIKINFFFFLAPRAGPRRRDVLFFRKKKRRSRF